MKALHCFFGILIFLSTSVSSPAQIPDLIKNGNYAVGENISTGDTIYGDAYNLPGEIFKFYVSSLSSNIWIELRKVFETGILSTTIDLQVFDKENLTGKWEKHYKFGKSDIYYKDDFVSQKVNSQFHVLDPETGKVLFKTNREFQYIIPEQNIGLGYWKNDDYPHTVEAFDLQTGQTLWRRKIPRYTTWNEVLWDSDSSLLISSRGLHMVHLNTGLGWSYDMESPIYDQFDRSLVVEAAAGVAFGLLTGTFFVPIPYQKEKFSINATHTISDQKHQYIGNEYTLTALDKQGQEIWKVPFPRKMKGITEIIKRQNNIIVLNYYPDMGVSVSGNVHRSFIASYDSKSGNTNYAIFPKPPVEDMFVLDFKLAEQYVDLLYPERVETFDLRDGNKVFSKYLDDSKFLYYISNDVFVENHKSLMIPLKEINRSHKFIYTADNKVLEYNGIYEKIRDYSPDNYYVLLYEIPGGYVMQNSTETIVVNKENKKTSRLHSITNPRFSEDKLYFYDHSQLIIVDIQKLLQN